LDDAGRGLTQRDAILFVATLLSGLTFVAVLTVLWLQRGAFRAVARTGWRRAFRNGALGWLLGLVLMLALGLLLPGRPLLDAVGAASDLTVVTAIASGMGMMLLASTALNVTLYAAAGRLSAHQARWSAAVIAGIYLVLVAGFSAATLA
jgi:hypothetical protein